MIREEFENYHEVDLLDFQKYIKSIGFKFDDNYHEYKKYYEYKKFRIYLYTNYYSFYNGYEWIYNRDLNDSTPLEKEFKNELRSIKLKELLR